MRFERSLSTRSFGRALTTSLTLASLALVSACSSLNSPNTNPVTATPLVITPKEALPPTATESLDELPPLHQTVERMNPSLYNALPDLFDRLRLGYQLDPVEDPAIDERVAFFLNHPAFIDQSFLHSERYLYFVVQEIENRQMPMELALLPVIESAYNPYAYSRARAAGMWQFIAPTAKRYAVKVDWWQDGRRDIIDSTRAALDYLSSLHEQFDHDWLLAVAAYNCGENAVQRAIDANKAQGLPTDFWHLRLPRETRAYVPSLLAMARIVATPAAYGLEFTPIPNRPYFARVEVDKTLNLRVAAQLLGLPKNELHALNPAFNRFATPPNEHLNLLVPVDAKRAFEDALNQKSADELMPLERVTLRKKQTLAMLAKERGLPLDLLTQLNPNVVVAGQSVVVPAGDTSPLRPDIIIESDHVQGKKIKTAHRYVRVKDPVEMKKMATLAQAKHLSHSSAVAKAAHTKPAHSKPTKHSDVQSP